MAKPPPERRIDISRRPLRVGRQMPAVLTGRMDAHQWARFCNKIDMALKIESSFRKIIDRTQEISAMFGGLAITVLFAKIIFLSLPEDSFLSKLVPDGAMTPLALMLPLTCGVYNFGSLLLVHTCGRFVWRRALQNVEEVCDDNSMRYDNVLFRLYDDGTMDASNNTSTYIELIVSDQDGRTIHESTMITNDQNVTHEPNATTNMAAADTINQVNNAPDANDDAAKNTTIPLLAPRKDDSSKKSIATEAGARIKTENNQNKGFDETLCSPPKPPAKETFEILSDELEIV